MSSLIKCGKKGCAKEINLQQGNYYTWSQEYKQDSKEYYCEKCGSHSIAFLRKIGGATGTIRLFKHFQHMGEGLKGIYSIIIDSLEHINLDFTNENLKESIGKEVVKP